MGRSLRSTGPSFTAKARLALSIRSLSSTGRLVSKSRSVEWRFRPQAKADAVPPLSTKPKSWTRARTARIKRS